MKIGVPRETWPGEHRVALVPAALKPLLKAGHEIVVETGAGVPAGYPDQAYLQAGAHVAPSRAEVLAHSELILQVRMSGSGLAAGTEADVALFNKGQILVGMADPLTEPKAMQSLAGSQVAAFAMEMMPRITRAQSMDVLSSMATVAGYEAVLIAAQTLPKMFPLLMTAAGTLSPARVFVIGAGVAGLQAIATAKRLGAQVSGYDVRPAVREQVESLGGKFVVLDLETGRAEDKGGYAAAQDESFYRRQRELMTNVIREMDVVITTAAVPGKKAPILVTQEMVEAMAPGSVVVDLAAERGGNCALTRPGETVLHKGVQVIGPLNLPSRAPQHASQMYARNLVNFLAILLKGGAPNLDSEDEVVRETLVVRDGQVTHARVRELLGRAPAAAFAGAP